MAAREEGRALRIRWWLVATVLLAGVATWRVGVRLPPDDWSEGALAGLELISRSAWNAAPEAEDLPDLGLPRRVTLHHSGGVRYERTARPEVGKTIRAIQEMHRKERGWRDIGYHLVIDPAGRLWEGRPLKKKGAHAGSGELNEGNLGVLLLGNFNVQQPSPEQLATLKELLNRLHDTCGISLSSVYTHKGIREAAGLATTECPGRSLERWVARLRNTGGW